LYLPQAKIKNPGGDTEKKSQTKTAVTTNKQASGCSVSGTGGMGSLFMLPGPSIALACKEDKTNK